MDINPPEAFRRPFMVLEHTCDGPRRSMFISLDDLAATLMGWLLVGPTAIAKDRTASCWTQERGQWVPMWPWQLGVRS